MSEEPWYPLSIRCCSDPEAKRIWDERHGYERCHEILSERAAFRQVTGDWPSCDPARGGVLHLDDRGGLMSTNGAELAEDHDFYPENQDRPQYAAARAATEKHFERLETFKPTEAMLEQMRGWLGVFGDEIVAEAKGRVGSDYLEHALADTVVQSPWVRVIEAAASLRANCQYLAGDPSAFPEFAELQEALDEAGL